MPFSWLICSLNVHWFSVWTFLDFQCETLLAFSVKLYGVCDPHFIYLKVNEMWITNSIEFHTQKSSGQHYSVHCFSYCSVLIRQLYQLFKMKPSQTIVQIRTLQQQVSARSTNETTEKLLSGMNQTVSWYRFLRWSHPSQLLLNQTVQQVPTMLLNEARKSMLPN